MKGKQLIECVPNFSEGRDMSIIKQITDVIESIDGVKLLDVDPGKATNRTVVTFVGEPDPVIKAAFLAIKKASEIIDMSKQSGEHPRMGATDVCPLIPISNITMEETAEYAHKLGKMAGTALEIPFYMYEAACTKPEWANLATIRSGEYEALPKKLQDSNWKPDYGPAKFNAQAGATAIGARDFLIAYNVNLNTKSVRRANSIAFDIREQGRVKRENDKVNGKIIKDKNGNPVRQAGSCEGVKAIGWYIDEYQQAQISMNITDVKKTSLQKAFEEVRKSANENGLRVTGSELVGLVPLKVMLDVGKYFLKKQRRSLGVSEREIVHIAIKSLGLDELGPFDPDKKIIEYQLRNEIQTPLLDMTLPEFANETASESMAPGGGSISAYVGSLGVSLGLMVANISGNRRVWDDRWEEFSEWAERGQVIKDELLALVDEDTKAFNGIIEAVRLPKSSDIEIQVREKAMQDATKYAIEVPYKVMEVCSASFELIRYMTTNGNRNSITDGGVGALCVRAAIHGAFMNVKVNSMDLDDKKFVKSILEKGEKLAKNADAFEVEIRNAVTEAIG